MVTQGWLYDAILYIYALSLLFYFSDFARSNRKAKRMGAGLLLFVWVLQTVFLAYRLLERTEAAVGPRFEALFLLSWLLVTISLLVSRFVRIELFVFLINLFGFAVLALNLFSNPNASPTLAHWNINDELMFVHISLSVASYAAFTISAAFSGMYLFLHTKLKGKQWSSAMQRLPSLEKMDRYAWIAVVTGTPLLLTGISLGLVWIALDGDLSLYFDPKVINSWFVLLAYVFYLFKRGVSKPPGNELALWNLLAFLIMVMNLIFANLYSSFHQWS